MGLGSRLKHAWNAFMNKDPTPVTGPSYSYGMHRPRFTRGNERSIVNAVYTRLSIDCSQVAIKHIQLDEDNRYAGDIESGLNNCFNLEANKDQTGRSFIHDIVQSCLDEGVVAIVPVDTSVKEGSLSYDTMRTGRVLQWYPDHVRVQVYNDRRGRREDIVIAKSDVAIVENPFYSVMNEPNSTMQRLIRKLNLLDAIDEQSGAGKLDLIIQLPYIIKSEARREQANKRRQEIEEQLAGSKYGIAYTDGTEKVTQLNRSLENNLMKQIEYLTSMLYSQLGITAEIMNGTADTNAMNNYYSRTIEPIMSAICDELKRKFLTKNARSRGQSIGFYRNMFKLISIDSLADLVDKTTRNEIMTSNEWRQNLGMKPSTDPSADQLRNKNLNQTPGQEMQDDEYGDYYDEESPDEEEYTE